AHCTAARGEKAALVRAVGCIGLTVSDLERKERLFLGIDHTAIVVSDTEASLRFYRDALGLRVPGGSENWGAEQERLNDVTGAHLRITTLRAGSGPGIEFLEYLEPRGGRPDRKST